MNPSSAKETRVSQDATGRKAGVEMIMYLFIEGLFITPSPQHLTLKKQYTKTNNILRYLKIVLSALPLCTTAIKPGHAGVADLSIQ